MSIFQQQHFQVSSELAQLQEVLNRCNDINVDRHIPPEIWMQCQTAIAEGFTNAVRYAHQGDKNLTIDIELTLTNHRLEICLWDYGQPFDFYGKLRELQPLDHNQSGGGRGLIILDKIADQLSYTYYPDKQRNCLLLVKTF